MQTMQEKKEQSAELSRTLLIAVQEYYREDKPEDVNPLIIIDALGSLVISLAISTGIQEKDFQLAFAETTKEYYRQWQ